MKIVGTSNLNIETVADVLIQELPAETTLEEGNKIAQDLNNSHPVNHRYYFVCKDDDYKLWRGWEELV